MQILENHQHPLPRRQTVKLSQERGQCLFLAPLRGEVGQRVARIRRQREQIAQKRNGSRVDARWRKQGFKLAELLRGRIAALEPRRPLELADEWEQRAVRAVRRADVSQPDVGFALQQLLERQRNPRLADAGLARDQHDATFALGGLLPASLQHLQLFFSTDQRRQVARMQRLETTLDNTYPRNLPRPDRLCGAGSVDFAEIAAIE